MTETNTHETPIPDYPRGITFEQVWAGLQETRRIVEENGRQQKESREDFDRRAQESDRKFQESGRRMEKLQEQMGDLNNRFGEMVEHLVAPSIVEKFNELGFKFYKYAPNVRITKPGTDDDLAEIDILLENGDTVIAVEVKAKATQKSVKKHIKRMQILRQYADLHKDKRRHHGAIAVAIMDRSLRSYILKQGFYLIEQTGDTVQINIPEGFKPREW